MLTQSTVRLRQPVHVHSKSSTAGGGRRGLCALFEQRQRLRWHANAAPPDAGGLELTAAAVIVEDSSASGAAARKEEPSVLVPPARRFQQALTPKERSERRTESEQLARDKKIVQVQVRQSMQGLVNGVAWLIRTAAADRASIKQLDFAVKTRPAGCCAVRRTTAITSRPMSLPRPMKRRPLLSSSNRLALQASHPRSWRRAWMCCSSGRL